MRKKYKTQITIDKKNFLFHPSLNSNEKITLENIECIFSENTSSLIFLNNKKHIRTNIPLKEWELLLPYNKFLRVNRVAIVNLRNVKLIEKSLNQTMIIHMQKYELPIVMSKSNTSKLRFKLKKNT